MRLRQSLYTGGKQLRQLFYFEKNPSDGESNDSTRRVERRWPAALTRLHRVVYYRPLLWLVLAVVLGVKLHALMPFSASLWLSALVTCLVVALVLAQRGWSVATGGAALLAAILFGGYYTRITTPPVSDSLAPLASRAAQPVALRGLIASAAVWKPNPNHRPEDPDSQAWQTQWDMRCQQVRDRAQWLAIDALSTLTVDGRVNDLLPGDRVEVMGDFRSIMPPTNPGAFDFATHFQREGKFVSLTAKGRQQIERLEATGSLPLIRLRAKLVAAVDQSLQRWVSPAQAPLAAALVFGQREQVDWEDQQALMATGTLHMLAISGMHVEIVAASVLLLAAPFGWRHSTLMLLIVSICGAYAVLAGGNPPVLRAVVVVAALALARTLGRPARLSNILGLAALVLLLNRVANVDNVGVQLSFLAVGSIGLFALRPDVVHQRQSALRSLLAQSQGHLHRWRGQWLGWLRQSWRLSLWVWLITCPLVWYHFHILAPIAIPLNVVIAVPLMLALISGLLTGVLGWLPPVGWLCGGLCGTALSVIDVLVTSCQHIPLGHLWLPAPPLWWIAIFYALVAVWLLIVGQRHNTPLLCLLLAWIGLAVAPHATGPRGWWGGTRAWPWPAAESNATNRVDELRCTFLDVGHGTSVIIELPGGQVWLYDAGHLGAASRSHQEIAGALWQLPTARIERLWVSHADSDHYNAIQGLLARFRVGSIASTSAFWTSPDGRVQALLEALPSRLARETFEAGAAGQIAGVTYQVLHPRPGQVAESDNASSLCLLLEYVGKRILLPGDLEGSGLLDLTNLPARPCHIVMAPHHGSLTLDPSDLLNWCRPEWIVISGNHRAARQPVIDKYRQDDSRLAITFRDGAIQIRIDREGGLSAWQWRAGAWQALR